MAAKAAFVSRKGTIVAANKLYKVISNKIARMVDILLCATKK